jgi:hypothetical protein
MTKLLERAIAEIRRLPDTVQDQAAEILLTLASLPGSLDPATRTAITEGQAQAAQGKFADEADMARLFEPRSE